jgi:hypothetical protein
MQIEVTPEFEGIAIRIGGVLHLYLDRKKFLAVQAWIMDGRTQFFIEYIMEGGSFTADYDTREKWEAILNGLDAVLAKQRFGGQRSGPQ